MHKEQRYHIKHMGQIKHRKIGYYEFLFNMLLQSFRRAKVKVSNMVYVSFLCA